MFTVTFKVTKKQLAAAAAAMIIAFAGGIWLKSAMSELDGDITGAPAVIKVEKAPAKTGEQRVAFLESFGWEVEEQEAEIVGVLIPKEFDGVYLKYNAIQKTQGCDLSRYNGKQCKRYTYVIKNYPGNPENVRANLLVYRDKIIGGDICSLELDGFMQGFAMETD